MSAMEWITGVIDEARARIDKRNEPKPRDTVGMITRVDWRGTPLGLNSLVVFPSEARGAGLSRSTTQMTEGRVVEIGIDGCIVAVTQRSRSGSPKGRQRKNIRLTPVGMVNVTVVA